MKPLKFKLTMQYLDLKITLEANSDEATTNSLQIASAMMREATVLDYPQPITEMKLGNKKLSR